MNSGADIAANLAQADRLLGDAAAYGCTIAVLPENFAFMPVRGRDKAEHAEDPGKGPIQEFLADVAERHNLWVVGGSIPLASPEPERVYGACPVLDNEGNNLGTYRKIHLFDVDLPEGEQSYRESHSMYAGDAAMVVETPAGILGLTICYDLRFPEIYRKQLDKGAELFLIVSAWPYPRVDAWRTLLKARAIENQAALVACNAAGQQSAHPYAGHSGVYDAWGEQVAELDEKPGILRAEIDLDAVRQTRETFPALKDRVLGIEEPTYPA